MSDVEKGGLISKMIRPKKRWRAYKTRSRQLPENYRTAVEAIERYLMHFVPTDGDSNAAMFEDLADLFEQAAANGTPIREIAGKDPAEFVEAIAQNYSEGGTGHARAETADRRHYARRTRDASMTTWTGMMSVDDTALAVSDTGGPSIPVVYLNGQFATQGYWRRVIADLGTGWRHITFDERRRGRKSGKSVDYSFEAAVRDVDAILAARGVDRAMVVGWSYGAWNEVPKSFVWKKTG
ncbi:alpha/beta fold hydrolase [Fodinicola feengrottensis]|nr:alpha/beta fold hydrolase [Fodinicola feengrottensis]